MIKSRERSVIIRRAGRDLGRTAVFGADRRIIVGGALALSLALALSACGRKAGPYAPLPPDPATQPQKQPATNPDGSRKFFLDPLL